MIHVCGGVVFTCPQSSVGVGHFEASTFGAEFHISDVIAIFVDHHGHEGARNKIYNYNKMASTRPLLAQLNRLCISSAPRPMVYRPAALIHNSIQQRFAAKKAGPNKYAEKRKAQKAAEKKKRKPRTAYIQYNLNDADQFALCDAMRYVWFPTTLTFRTNAILAILGPQKSAGLQHK